MYKRSCSNQGMTLVELIISLTIALVVITAASFIFHLANKSYLQTQARWQAHQKIRTVGLYMDKQISKANAFTINYDTSISPGSNDFDIYIRNYDPVGDIMFRNSSQTGCLATGSFTLSFSNTTSVNGSNKAFSNVLFYEMAAQSTAGNEILRIKASARTKNAIPDRIPNPASITGTRVRVSSVNPVVPPPSLPNLGGCFIATAAYGSIMAPQVELLRQFRDEFLLTTGPGVSFVEWYYRNSPPLAEKIKHNEKLRFATQVLLLPVIAMAYLSIHYDGLLTGCFLLICLLLFRHWFPRYHKTHNI
ncbi:MAG: prepilin-type N-terminal cleavage/methylation domain-containing protein [Syntrophomonadaceae bacterium]|nr:prepilin-type N-terminal cleavage/methylation domain-containing protein [Syntrophomonadaceae bacterium]